MISGIRSVTSLCKHHFWALPGNSMRKQASFRAPMFGSAAWLATVECAVVARRAGAADCAPFSFGDDEHQGRDRG